MSGSPAAEVAVGAETPGLRVLIAPDCYGESLTAERAAAAIAAGWHSSRPADRLNVSPQSDGGPGFVAVLSRRLGTVRELQVAGPLDDDVEADWLFDADSKTAYVECAQACGMALLAGPPSPRTALAAHSRGVGQLIMAALQEGAERIVVGLGGSASTDGGRGLVETLGGLDAARRRLAGIELIAAADVEYPLLGPWGAARIFGPQKGADAVTVIALEQRLDGWGAELDAAAGRVVSAASGAGAAGGIGAALLALGAGMESGAEIVARHTHLGAEIAAADLLVTGEGRLDEQSLHGKVVGAITGTARAVHVPVLVLAGQVSLEESAVRAAGILAVRTIAEHAGSVRLALVDAANQLMELATATAAEFETWPTRPS